MKILYFVIAGVAGGILGGMGMGGGTVLIPILSVILSVEQHTAQAVNLVSFIPMAAVALIIHAKNGILDAKGIIPVIVPAVFASAGFSYLASVIEPQVLKRVFGGFLIVFSVVQFFIAIKKYNNKTNKTAG